LKKSRASSPELFADLLHELRGLRRQRKQSLKIENRARQSLSAAERNAIFTKTGGRCHVCGGTIHGAWQADHVFPHSSGGDHAADNYLPAHPLCNNYRWDYTAEEFQYILKLGVWLRTQIERKTPLGLRVAQSFLAYEAVRESRRKRPQINAGSDPTMRP
jgi:5-methylcytosine-specific restriction endonuclease McrA